MRYGVGQNHARPVTNILRPNSRDGSERPLLKIIAMSSRPEAEQAALEAGVPAFLSKGDPTEWVLSILSQEQSQQRRFVLGTIF